MTKQKENKAQADTKKKRRVETTTPNKNSSPTTNRKGREKDNTRSHKRYIKKKKKNQRKSQPHGRWTKPTVPRAKIQISGQTHDLAQRHQNTLPPYQTTGLNK
jgi:hypothetical protein